MTPTSLRRFHILRKNPDPRCEATMVAEGVLWSTGTASLRWGTGMAHPVVLYDSLDDLIANVVGDNQRIEWIDPSAQELAEINLSAVREINAAWDQAHADMQKIMYGSQHLDWRDPVQVLAEQRRSRGIDWKSVSRNIEPVEYFGAELDIWYSNRAEEDSEPVPSSHLPFHGFDVGYAIIGDFSASSDFDIDPGDPQQADLTDPLPEEPFHEIFSWLHGVNLAVGPVPRETLVLLLGEDPWAEVLVGKDVTINSMQGDLIFRPYGPSSSGPVPEPTETSGSSQEQPQGPAHDGMMG